MSTTELVMVTKSVQSIYNRTMPRAEAAAKAELTAQEIGEHFAEYVNAFGTADIFDLAELVALEVVAS